MLARMARTVVWCEVRHMSCAVSLSRGRSRRPSACLCQPGRYAVSLSQLRASPVSLCWPPAPVGRPPGLEFAVGPPARRRRGRCRLFVLAAGLACRIQWRCTGPAVSPQTNPGRSQGRPAPTPAHCTEHHDGGRQGVKY